ncbi:MAG: enoyl-CoA hydratase-related protein [Bacteroidota bacterium]
MSYEILEIQQAANGITTVTINRAAALNALNEQTLLELQHFFSKEACEIEGLKGIILTGAGEKAFVAGADIKEFLGLNADKAASLSKRGQDIFFLIERFTKPVIAVVNGYALGGGCELAMACHMRIATENAKFGQPEVNLGIIPGYGGTQRLVQYIGKGKAMELMLTADIIGAEEANHLGLINYVFPTKAEAIGKATNMIQKIATKGPVAIAKVIESVNAYFEESVDGFEREVEKFGQTAGTADFVEGASAFVEKRKPNFNGK